MTKIELLKKYHDMACHNLFCYSRNYAMTEPKEGYEAEWKQAGEEVKVLEEMIKELEQVKIEKGINEAHRYLGTRGKKTNPEAAFVIAAGKIYIDEQKKAASTEEAAKERILKFKRTMSELKDSKTFDDIYPMLLQCFDK